MSKTVTPLIGLLITLIVLSTQSLFAFGPAVDTFEAGFDPLPTSIINDENGCTAVSAVGLLEDPSDADNIVMNVRDTADDKTYKTIPTMTNATVSTLYFRFRINGSVPDINVGASDSATPTLTTHQRAVVRFENTMLQINDGSWRILTNVSMGAWYQLWIVVNSPADNRYEVYIAEDNSDTPIQLSDGSNTDFLFRNGAAGDLISFFVHCNGANIHAGDQTLIDDIYVDTSSKNLADARNFNTQPTLTYLSTALSESAPNNGQIGDKINIMLTNDVFNTNSPMHSGTHYTASGVPAGLSLQIDTINTNQLSATLIGAATSHGAADSTSLLLTFLDAAFVNSGADEVDNLRQSISVIFDDPTPPGWQLTDNFEALGALTNAVPLDGTNQWTSDHLDIVAIDDGTANNVAQVRGVGSNSGTVASTGTVAWKPSGKQHSGTNGTLFFRFRLPNTVSSDINVGLTGVESDIIPNLHISDQATIFGPALRIADDKLMVLNNAGTVWKNIASDLVAGIWYQLWMIMDNPADLWSAYIQGGVYTNQSQLGFDGGAGVKVTNFVFRTQTEDTNLINLIMRGNGVNGAANSVWLDDIYINLRDQDLSAPQLSTVGTVILVY